MLYTIGHSVLAENEFENLVSKLDIIWDVRSHPGSSKYPIYNKENLIKWMKRIGIQYEWVSDLGGWRDVDLFERERFLKYGVDVAKYASIKFPKHYIAKTVQKNDFGPLFSKTEKFDKPSWTNVGLYDYSWFMTLNKFLKAVDVLIALGEKNNIGIMCAELLWWKCHRSMISDYVAWRGVKIYHLQPKFVEHYSGDME